jgi:hypothetical protein
VERFPISDAFLLIVIHFDSSFSLLRKSGSTRTVARASPA